MQAALEKLKRNPEPEAGFMLVRQQALPAYNVQTAVDTGNALIVAHTVVLDASDISCLKRWRKPQRKYLESIVSMWSPMPVTPMVSRQLTVKQ
jgi:hypothetical protein